MKVYIDRGNRNIEITKESVQDILFELKINPTTVLVSVNNKLVDINYKVKQEDKVEILSVISGG
ncbi:MoaD/ThiS family protein [Candidatus Woesearchaeota archaeon]|nr:MoaD/ThiS family protein [Candidatus Woesearchaeota archaeon]